MSDDRWIPWDGGDTCPLPDGTVINICYQDGAESEGNFRAEELDWNRVKGFEFTNIGAYRIVDFYTPEHCDFLIEALMELKP